MATAPKEPKDQTEDFMKRYFPNWNNFQEPKSYLMPPIFHCKKTFNISDKTIDELEEARKLKDSKYVDTPVLERKSSKPEYIIYRAIQELIKDGIQKPFIAVYSLDINGQRNKIKTIYWNNNAPEWNKWEEKYETLNPDTRKHKKEKSGKKEHFLHEHDFVLIGPKIGLVVIEAKLGEGVGESIFNGYKQLRDVNALVSLMDLCVCGKMVDDPQLNSFVRRVMFASVLDKSKYDEDLRTVQISNKPNDKENIKRMTEAGHVIHLFQEDKKNWPEDDGKPELYTQLCRKVLEMPLENYNPTMSSILETLYLNYAPIIACLKSVVQVKSANYMLDDCNFSEMNMVLREYTCLTKYQRPHPPEQENENVKAKNKKEDKVILFSPDQQSAFNGPCRQLIFGLPGTGKTILLEAKCLELLRQDHTVTVMAPKSYAWHYKMLFDNRGFEEGKLQIIDCKPKIYFKQWIRNLLKTIFTNPLFAWNTMMVLWPLRNLFNELRQNMRNNPRDSAKIGFICDFVQHTIMNVSDDNRVYNWLCQMFEKMFGPGHLIIDDGLEEFNGKFGKPQNYFLAIKLIMALAKKKWSDKYVWIASDPYGEQKHKRYKTMHQAVSAKLLEYRKQPDDNFEVVLLTEVMRCCKTIFEAAYENINWPHKEVKPTLGHWIEGCPIFMFNEKCTTFDDALKSIFDKIKNVIEAIINRDKIDLKNVGIVIGTCEDQQFSVRDYLREQCGKTWSNIKIGPLGETVSEDQLQPEVKLAIDDKNVLCIQDWNKVSSLEWPVVLYINCLPVNYKMDHNIENINYQRYRSLSRGVIKVVEFQFTYEQ